MDGDRLPWDMFDSMYSLSYQDVLTRWRCLEPVLWFVMTAKQSMFGMLWKVVSRWLVTDIHGQKIACAAGVTKWFWLTAKSLYIWQGKIHYSGIIALSEESMKTTTTFHHFQDRISHPTATILPISYLEQIPTVYIISHIAFLEFGQSFAPEKMKRRELLYSFLTA